MIFNALHRVRIRELEALVEQQQATIDGLEAHMKKRAELVNIERQGSSNRFTFLRNGQHYVVQTYATIADNLPGWKRDLIE